MRIADKMQYDSVNGNIQKNRSQMSDLQNQAATQKRVNKPSDDPLAAARVLSTRVDLQGNRQYVKNLTYARGFLEFTDQALGDLTEVLVRAKELAINQASDASGNEETRRTVATEIEQLSHSMVGIGNRKLADRFIFGGFRTQSAPFTRDGTYQGDEGEMNVNVDKGAFLPMNVPGSRVFLGIGINEFGAVKGAPPQARSVAELHQQNVEEPIEGAPELTDDLPERLLPDETERAAPLGVNLFRIIKDLEVSLRTNDKAGVQDSLDLIDSALSQVVATRSQVGSRAASLNQLTAGLEKAKIDDQATISTLEDADVFETVSDINRTQATLQATLQTSGKIVQQSLMDFLR